jgi:NADH-quinone oxidoreductase subunit M
MIFNRLDKPENERLTDLGRRELALMAPLLIGIVWLGLYPAPVLKRMESATRRYVQLTQPARHTNPVAVQGTTARVAP